MWIETLILGFALSMDAFAVTIANAFAYPKTSKGKSYLGPLFFALFQGFMPVIGYLLGSYASEIILRYQGIVSLLILGIIGGKMVYDGIKGIRNPDEENASKGSLSIKVVLLQAIATSIDALAVGVAYVSGDIPIGVLALIILLTTLASCTVAWLIGRKFGEALGAKAQIVGGIVLICIGIKAMFF